VKGALGRGSIASKSKRGVIGKQRASGGEFAGAALGLGGSSEELVLNPGYI
jgi:hypothetical protein